MYTVATIISNTHYEFDTYEQAWKKGAAMRKASALLSPEPNRMVIGIFVGGKWYSYN